MSDYDEPWRVRSILGVVPPTAAIETATRTVADGFRGHEKVRVCRCINALAGIPDPAAFVKEAKALMVLTRRCATELAFDDLGDEQIAALAAEWTPDE